MDSLTNMNDTYVEVSLHGAETQSTDIHWRAKGGKASWNYRLLFDVKLGENEPTYKFPHLGLKMWDKDVLKYDDLIAETVLSLQHYFRKALAYSTQEEKKLHVINLFEDAKRYLVLSNMIPNMMTD